MLKMWSKVAVYSRLFYTKKLLQCLNIGKKDIVKFVLLLRKGVLDCILNTMFMG